MQPDKLPELINLLKANKNDIINQWVQDNIDAGYYTKEGKEFHKKSADGYFEAFMTYITHQSEEGFIKLSEMVISVLSTSDSRMRNSFNSVFAMREVLATIIKQNCSLETQADFIQQCNQWVEETLGIQFETYMKVRDTFIETQQRAISDLSTPIIKVWDSVLALPLIGTIDTKRAAQITSHLLNQMVSQQAEFAILDITGVALLDTQVANHLITMIKAVKLIGADIILTGISPSIAQTMIRLGIDLDTIQTRKSIKDALECILKHKHKVTI